MRPMMSVLPSPSKSPTLTSTHVKPADHTSHSCVWNADPVEVLTNHCPFCKSRPAMSALPSPLKSPTTTSAQVIAAESADQPPQNCVLKAAPVATLTYHWPFSLMRPARAFKTAPLKGPTLPFLV